MEHLGYDFHIIFPILGVITQQAFFSYRLCRKTTASGHGIMAGCRH